MLAACSRGCKRALATAARAPRRAIPAADAAAADSYRLADQVRQLVQHPTRKNAPIAATSNTDSAYSPALSLIRSAPPSAATVVVWNVLLNAILTPPPSRGGQGHAHAHAVRRAYEIWMEMKRRGVVPTSRSYGTFLTGVAKRAKRAAFEADPAPGWNADLRAKVETVHKQWRTHCDRVRERAHSSSSSLGSGAGAGANAVTDGRHDSIESLSPLPTNQYLSFLSAALTLTTTTTAIPGTTAAAAAAGAPTIFDHLVRTFEAMPDPDQDPHLGRTTVSYQVVYAAFKTVLTASSGSKLGLGKRSAAPEEDDRVGVEGLELRSSPGGNPAQEDADSESLFPTAQQILDRALAMWDHLVLHPPTPEVPTAASSSSSALGPGAGGLTPIVPTALLSLYLSLPLSTSSTLPPATHARFLAVPARAFGFVEPGRAADLEPPHPEELQLPLCDQLDEAAFGAALRTARRAPVEAGKKDDPLRWARAWWDQVRDYPERFGLTTPPDAVVGLLNREAAHQVMKAAGRAGDVEAIEDLVAYLTTTSLATTAPAGTHHHAASEKRWYRTHAPLVSTYTLAISCLSRVGTQPALSAALRLWHDLVRIEPPFVPSPARPLVGSPAEGEGERVAKAAYVKAAYECVRMAVMGVRERTAVWAAVKAVAGGSAAFEPSPSASVTADTASSSSSAAPDGVGAFHPARFPPPSSAVARRNSPEEIDLLARILHNALGRILSGDGRPGDLSAQLGRETVAVLEAWRGRLKAYLRAVESGERGGGGVGAEVAQGRRTYDNDGGGEGTSRGRAYAGGSGGGNYQVDPNSERSPARSRRLAETDALDTIGETRMAGGHSTTILSGGDVDPIRVDPNNPLVLVIVQLCLILILSRILAFAFKWARQPRVVSEILAGILLGPTAFGQIPGFTDNIFPSDSIPYLSLIANLGLVLFLFVVGTDVDFSLLRRNVRPTLAVSTAGLVIPFGLGCAVSVGLYNQFIDGSVKFTTFMCFIGTSSSITAFPVLSRILSELQLFTDPVGLVVLASGVVNDVIGWCLLALSVALASAGSGVVVVYILLTMFGWTLGLFFIGRPALNWLARKTGSWTRPDGPTQGYVCAVLGLVLVSAFFCQIIGISEIFGGFLVGLIIPRSLGHHFAQRIEDLVTCIFIPLYFATSGLRTDLTLLNSGIIWGWVICVMAVAFSGKFIGSAVAARISGFGWRQSGATGALMSAKGLIELIVLNQGLQVGIISQTVFSIFVLEALVLTIAATPLTLAFYPPHHRPSNKAAAAAASIGVPRSSTDKGGLALATRTRFTVVLDQLESFGAVMVLTHLLGSSMASPPRAPDRGRPRRRTRSRRSRGGQCRGRSDETLRVGIVGVFVHRSCRAGRRRPGH
ncbi:hypothetical protein JCM3774_004524 [Rhodotorula dairenensis]